ncbi:hypothetical protein [Microcella sp.]|uniref:hypothetical protein n=1 Tax=Microcella sp. TaxID=1913979 RepID=UPI0039188678
MSHPARPTARTRQTAHARAIALAAATLLALAGCAGPDPNALPSSPDAPAASPSPSADGTQPDGDGEATDRVPLPTCDDIYSDELVAELTDEGRESLGDTAAAGAGGWGSGDAVLIALLQGAMERVSCSWILPFSESGSTTTIIRIDEATAAFLDEHLTDTAGFTVTSALSGQLYTLEVEGDFPYSEAHLIVDGLLIATEAFGGDAEPLTVDAGAQLSAP